MISRTLILLTLAVVLGLLGFTVLVGAIALVAKVVCILLLVSLILCTLNGTAHGKLP